MSGDASIKSTWTALFSRKGGSGATTRLWDDWDDQTLAEVLHDLHLDGDELPVLLIKPLGAARTVLTTRRLLWGWENAAVADIVEIKPLQFREKRKDQLDELSVRLISGETVRIPSESGPPYFALWSVLLNISKRNARQQAASDSCPRSRL